ncbi:aldose 1-epimerase [Palleronia salina]|uniref:Aldose 1-epimerase n=1 Tax=Palleronia salina TaxID=313368 RepID=A0A1M6KTS9_9RHOB|nr:aldose epimerase family protein [Palleronia salina]SHJ62418.1 aldose 1-epimerase [Palleronia salina]
MIERFGTLPDGRTVERITLRNDALTVQILTLGALIQDVRLAGVDFSLTLGSPDLSAYTRICTHFGAVMGPVANRIGGAKATLDGTEYQLDANQDDRHTLHGGAAATHTQVWEVVDQDDTEATLALSLPDGAGGFPGNRRIEVEYALDGATLRVTFRGATDAPTWMNLASHGYWTMQPPAGWGGQLLQVLADRYLPTDGDDLPTGEIAEVAGTPYDFREGVTLDLDTTPRLDHNFCLADAPRALTPALRLSAPDGPSLEIATTAPGMQVFDMHKFAVEEETNHRQPYPRRAAMAFEPQHWPDAPNNPGFPSVELRPGAVYSQTTEYRFDRAAR